MSPIYGGDFGNIYFLALGGRDLETKISSLNIPEEVLQSGIGITESGTIITVQEYFQNILANSKPLDPEFAKILHDNFWDLLA